MKNGDGKLTFWPPIICDITRQKVPLCRYGVTTNVIICKKFFSQMRLLRAGLHKNLLNHIFKIDFEKNNYEKETDYGKDMETLRI